MYLKIIRIVAFTLALIFGLKRLINNVLDINHLIFPVIALAAVVHTRRW